MKELIFFCLFLGCCIYPQEYGMGLILDDKKFETTPTSAPLMRGSFDALPDSVSLKQFCPTPGNQGRYGTCTGWASAYAARTILEAKKHKWSSQDIDSNAFSPSFVYNQIRMREGCMDGASIIDALELLKFQGDVKYSDFRYDCNREVTQQDRVIAEKYKIIEYREIAGRNTVNKAKLVKKSLAEDNPVVIAFDTPPSFNRVKGFWLPDSSDYKEWGRGHAMTVIGYSDNIDSGSFELINSWGSNWGNNGFGRIRYKDFEYFCKIAFELIDISQTDTLTPDLSGSMLFRESDGKNMRAIYKDGYFVLDRSYPSGTLFELQISNNQPAYVYAFSSDLTNKTDRIFPFDERMIAYLPYKSNNIAIPDEETYNMLDSTRGTSYYCFLYSKEPIDLDSLRADIENRNGNMWERICGALGKKTVETNNIQFRYEGKIYFEAISKGRTVVPVLVEINHI